MPDITEVSHHEAQALADSLTRIGTGEPLGVRVTTLEVQARTAGRLIRAMLRQTHASDHWRLDPEA
jgi:hypothetical protein